jgi:hypothetical protein
MTFCRLGFVIVTPLGPEKILGSFDPLWWPTGLNEVCGLVFWMKNYKKNS